MHAAGRHIVESRRAEEACEALQLAMMRATKRADALRAKAEVDVEHAMIEAEFKERIFEHQTKQAFVLE